MEEHSYCIPEMCSNAKEFSFQRELTEEKKMQEI